MANEPTSIRGRKRSEETRAAILRSALEILAADGFAALTIEGIARRSGAGKQSIYRWWPTKADVLLEALLAKADLFVPLDDRGSYAADLRAFLDATFALAERADVADVLRATIAQAQIDAEFGVRFRTGFIEQRRAALRGILDRAAARGDRPSAPSIDFSLDLVFGVLWYRLLTARAADPSVVEDLTRALGAGDDVAQANPAGATASGDGPS